MVGAQVLTSDDEPKPKPDVTLAALKNACKTLGQPISGTKNKLAMRIDTMGKKKSRDNVTRLPLTRRLQAAKLYARFSRFPARDVKTAYALNASYTLHALDVTEANIPDNPNIPDIPDIRGNRPGTVSRRKVYREAMKMYGDARSLRREIRTRDYVRRVTQARRREELAEALTKRRPWLRARQHSAICAKYVAGEPGAPSLERAVDVAEEIHFLYQHTQYPTILRELRAASRDMDREFGDPGYWRKRDMVKDGLIKHMDDDTPDGSEDDYDYDKREEEARHEKAKRQAVQAWLKRNESDTSSLPRSLK